MSYIIFSPHIDDAMLSLGGLITSLLDQSQDITIEYIFSISNWTNPSPISRSKYGTDVQEITGLRKNEESDIHNSLSSGYSLHYWDLPDEPLRTAFTAQEQVSLGDQIKAKIACFADSKDQLLFPLGLGHPDHKLMTEQGLWLLKEGRNVLFYEDMPYFAMKIFDHFAFHANLFSHGLSALSQAFDPLRKYNIITSYSSQVADTWITDMNKYSYSPKDNSYFERWWKPRSPSVTWEAL